jgi:hypothetical protein
MLLEGGGDLGDGLVILPWVLEIGKNIINRNVEQGLSLHKGSLTRKWIKVCMEIIEGLVFSHTYVEDGIEIGQRSADEILNKYDGKRIRMTIEEI